MSSAYRIRCLIAKNVSVIARFGCADISASIEPLRATAWAWWYPRVCSAAGIVVHHYTDKAEAIMEEDASGAGRFVPAMLRPNVVIQAGGDVARAAELHTDIASSPIR